MDDNHLDDTNVRGSIIEMPGTERDARATEEDDCSYEETTNCRLREETNATMLFNEG